MCFESIFKKAFSKWAVVGTEELLPDGEDNPIGVVLLERVFDVPLFADRPLLGGLADISTPLKFQLLSFGSSIAPLLKFLFSFALMVRQKLLLPAITILLCREPKPALQIRMHRTLASVMYQGPNLVYARHQM